jgi:hypothetical protein
MGVQQRLDGMEGGRPRPPKPQPGQPRPPTVPKVPAKPSPASKLYEAKAGFANFYFNKLERDRLWSAFRNQGDFSTQTGEWKLAGELELGGKKNGFTATVGDEKGTDGKPGRTRVIFTIGVGRYDLDPLATGQKIDALAQPPRSGGLLMALYQYRRLLTMGDKGFEGGFSHGGREPFYPMPADGSKPKSYRDVRVDTEVLQTEHAAAQVKWYFSLTDQALLGGEFTLSRDEDPCELYFSDYKPVDGRMLPHRIEVRNGADRWGVLTVQKYEFGK